MTDASNPSMKRITAIVAALVISFLFAVSPLRAALRAGAARIDITPQKPVKLSGYASRKALSEGIHDPLSARAIAFESGGKRLVLVSCDLIGFYDGTAAAFRKLIVDEFKLEPAELFLCGIHTHSAPTLTLDKEKVHPNNFEYTKSLEGKLIDVVRKALDNMGPAQVGVGVGSCPIGANRRELTFDKLGNSSIRLGRNPYGPTDKEVLVMKVAGPDGTLRAELFDYATHATCMGGRNLIITGDVLGLSEQFVEKILGPDVIAAAFAGASGNIDPWFRVLPAFDTEPGWIPEPVLLGTFLGEEVVHVSRDVGAVSAGGEIVTSFATLELPGKPEGRTDVPKNCPPTSLNITAARIGNVAFVGFGAEVLTQIGMAIKAASPYKHTFVITHCNGAAGYLPPKDLYVEGGYEINSSPFAPQAAEMVVKQAVKMLHKL
jgi:Neutral/alkaline non-lysosomal ceramidase, N-terminal